MIFYFLDALLDFEVVLLSLSHLLHLSIRSFDDPLVESVADHVGTSSSTPCASYAPRGDILW